MSLQQRLPSKLFRHNYRAELATATIRFVDDLLQELIEKLEIYSRVQSRLSNFYFLHSSVLVPKNLPKPVYRNRFTEKSIHRKKINERHLTETQFGRTSFDRKITEKSHLVQFIKMSVFIKMSFDRIFRKLVI
jgi:hypothetical protein